MSDSDKEKKPKKRPEKVPEEPMRLPKVRPETPSTEVTKGNGGKPDKKSGK